MTFNARTATPAEFEAEARRLHAERVKRINSMTPEEQEACKQFMMPGLLDRYRTLTLNQLVPVSTVEMNVAECVKHYRNDLWQSSPEHNQALDTARQRWPRDGGRQRAYIEEQEQRFLDRLQSHANARARWVREGHDPSAIDEKARRDGRLPSAKESAPAAQAAPAHEVSSEKSGRTTWIVVDGQRVGRARAASDAEKIVQALKR